MGWININNELPKINENCWRTDEPIIVKLADGRRTIAYYEKIEDSAADGNRYISTNYSAKFVCADRYADNHKEILANVVEWMRLPE